MGREFYCPVRARPLALSNKVWQSLYISKQHLHVRTAYIIEVCQIKFLGYVGYKMPHVNNVNFSESKYALLVQHTTENNFWRQ